MMYKGKRGSGADNQKKRRHKRTSQFGLFSGGEAPYTGIPAYLYEVSSMA